MKKPREFWIIKNEKHHTGLEWYDAFKHRQTFIRTNEKHQIHVIDKSAYDIAVEALKFYAKGEGVNDGSKIECDKHDCWMKTSGKSGTKARETLKSLGIEL